MDPGRERYDGLIEDIRSGGSKELRDACNGLMLAWKELPVEPLLLLREQFRRLDLDQREAHIDELLISVAEKRPGPFTVIASDPANPAWRPAVEVLSMTSDPAYLDLLLSLLPGADPKDLQVLVRAIGSYSGRKVVESLAPYLSTEDEGVFFEVVMALRKTGGPEVLRHLRNTLDARRIEGSKLCSVLEGVIAEMAPGWSAT